MSHTKTLFLFLFAICSFNNLIGQSKKLDSLWKIYNTTGQDTIKINLINEEIGFLYESINSDSAIMFYEKAILLADKNLDSLSSLSSLQLMNTFLMLKSTSLRYIGIVYSDHGEFDKSIEYYFKSLKIKEKLDDKRGIAQCNLNIGSIFGQLGSNDKALEYFFKSLKISQDIGDKEGMAISYNNIGNALLNKKLFEKAIEYYLKPLKIFEEMKDKYGMSLCYDNIGNAYQFQGNYDKAIECFLESLKLKETIGDIYGTAACYNNIGSLNLFLADSTSPPEYLRLKYINKAILFGNKAYTLALQMQAITLEKDAAQTLMEAYSKFGNYKKAIEYSKIYNITKDSLYRLDKTKSIADAEAKFKSEKKQLEIDKLNKEKELQQSELLRQKLLILFVIAGIILISAFTVFVVNRLRITRRQKEEISKQHGIVTKQKDRIEKQKQQITNSINYAKRIQKAVLPSDEYAKSILGEYFILFKPKDIVSGDFYWATLIKEKLIIAVADCTGHGVPGAFMSMLGVSFLNEIVRKKEVIKASDVLDHLRDSIIEALQQKGTFNEQKDGMDIAICVLNMQTYELQYAGAYNPLYIVKAPKEIMVISADKQPVAIYENMKSFTNNELQLVKGDCIYLFSDGYVDQFGGLEDKKFMAKQLKDILLTISEKPMEEQRDILKLAFENWKGTHDQIDDVTVLGIRI